MPGARYGERCGVPTPSHPPSTATCLPTQKLLQPLQLGSHGGSITWAWLSKFLATDDPFNLEPVSPPLKSAVGLKVPTLESCGWFPWQPGPFLRLSRGFPKKSLININSLKGLLMNSKTLISPLLLRNQGQKSKYCNNRYTRHSYHLGNCRVLGALYLMCPCGTMDKYKNIYYYILL